MAQTDKVTGWCSEELCAKLSSTVGLNHKYSGMVAVASSYISKCALWKRFHITEIAIASFNLIHNNPCLCDRWLSCWKESPECRKRKVIITGCRKLLSQSCAVTVTGFTRRWVRLSKELTPQIIMPCCGSVWLVTDETSSSSLSRASQDTFASVVRTQFEKGLVTEDYKSLIQSISSRCGTALV